MLSIPYGLFLDLVLGPLGAVDDHGDQRLVLIEDFLEGGRHQVLSCWGLQLLHLSNGKTVANLMKTMSVCCIIFLPIWYVGLGLNRFVDAECIMTLCFC